MNTQPVNLYERILIGLMIIMFIYLFRDTLLLIYAIMNDQKNDGTMGLDPIMVKIRASQIDFKNKSHESNKK